MGEQVYKKQSVKMVSEKYAANMLETEVQRWNYKSVFNWKKIIDNIIRVAS